LSGEDPDREETDCAPAGDSPPNRLSLSSSASADDVWDPSGGAGDASREAEANAAAAAAANSLSPKRSSSSSSLSSTRDGDEGPAAGEAGEAAEGVLSSTAAATDDPATSMTPRKSKSRPPGSREQKRNWPEGAEVGAPLFVIAVKAVLVAIEGTGESVTVKYVLEPEKTSRGSEKCLPTCPRGVLTELFEVWLPVLAVP
jgi:hypothetical protein